MTKGKSTNPAINYSCVVRQGTSHGPCPIPQEGSWTKSKEIKDISGLSHGVGGCAPRQGACKLTLNVKRGIIEEALIETLGCSGMTHSACMAGEIIKGKTLLEALNTDLVCDAINDAMKDIFFQLVYGRSQSAFSAGGLEIGAGIEELGSSLVSQFGTVYTGEQGVRYLQTTEGYITKVGLDKNDEVIGYEFVNLGRFMQKLKQGKTYDEAYEQSMGTYGRFSEAVKIIDPRD
ncbi:MAG: iron-sulfur cluster assembly scaffold protein [Firmicutes bacterium]|nr:iron-sulfur cluster assembly scaffold protein [Bacillota bacterium]